MDADKELEIKVKTLLDIRDFFIPRMEDNYPTTPGRVVFILDSFLKKLKDENPKLVQELIEINNNEPHH
jgi:hypothetical protein